MNTVTNPINFKFGCTGLTVTQWIGSIAGSPSLVYYNYLSEVCNGGLDASKIDGTGIPNSAR